MRMRFLRLLVVASILAVILAGCGLGGGATVTVVVTPTVSATTTPAPTATATPPPTGAISGHLGYPASEIPPLIVYAISTTDSSVFFHVTTAHNQLTYTIAGVTPGVYHVIAYLTPDNPALRGGYSQFVLCGNAASCPSHALVAVVVAPGATISHIDPTDWYAPAGAFPAPPH
jgi:hypothetical protein